MAKDGFHQTGTVVLDCRHSVTIALPLPIRGDAQFCRLCNGYRLVQDTHDSYVVKCNSGRCRLNRNMKADKAGALALARKHVAQYTRHKVTVFDGRLTCAEVSNTDETLFTTADDRAAIAAESQNLLRNLGLGSTGQPPRMG